MNQQAIEAATDELNRVLYPEADIPKIGKIRKEYSRLRVTGILEAALPHIEAELRQKIAAEINDYRARLTDIHKDESFIDYVDYALKGSTRIAERKV